MKISFAIFSALLLGLVLSAPTFQENDDKVTITEKFFPQELAIYTAEHDIVNLIVPLNDLNFDEDDDETANDDNKIITTLFFVEADLKENGEKVDQGLYVLKDGKAKKILDNGRDAAPINNDGKIVYFGASDGIYIYNEKENSAEKYGSLNDNIIGIAKGKGTDLIYILTADHEVYKVTNEGKVKTKIDEIKIAQQIVSDFANNLYFTDDSKNVYVYTGDKVLKINNLPENSSYLNLIKPSFVIEDGIPVIVDKKSYIVYVNGSSEVTDFEFEVRPTAYAMEATLFQFYAYNKTIYKYNTLSILLNEVIDDLKSFLSGKEDEIKSMFNRPISDIKA